MPSKAPPSTPGTSYITARPTPKQGSASTTVTTPSIPISTPGPFTHLSSSGTSYFSAYGAAAAPASADPLAQKSVPEAAYSGSLTKETDIIKTQIQKPKHKYPFQFLNQVSKFAFLSFLLKGKNHFRGLHHCNVNVDYWIGYQLISSFKFNITSFVYV